MHYMHLQLPYAGGGKGGSPPLHPRPWASPLGTPNWCDHFEESQTLMAPLCRDHRSKFDDLGI